jgi:peptidyl-prolyl cis-trans isomerase A (cyclophilin A)
MTLRMSVAVILISLVGLGCGEPAEPQAKPKSATMKPGAAKPPAAAPAPAPAVAPNGDASFSVQFETTKGVFVIDVFEDWSPQGAARFRELVAAGYFNDTAFFRVIAGFMVQVGISGDPARNAEWRAKPIQDDPVKQSNTRGMVTFAKTGQPNSRTTQFFVNFGNNARLDGMGFSPFGKVREMKVIDSLHAGYGEGAPRGQGPSQGRMQAEGNAYLKKEFPALDYIKTATILAP